MLASPFTVIQEPARPALSRTLFLPGPLPPLSHFGVTLLGYSLGTGLRYCLYHLGLPPPEAPPVRIVRLRPYFEARPLRELLSPVPGGPDVLGALLEPGGAAPLPALSPGLNAALAFHRLRLAARRAKTTEIAVAPDEAGPALWQRLRGALSRGLSRVNDALLAEVVAALDRRALRARGEPVAPALSRAAWALRNGRRADLARFGLPDPLAPSWKLAPEEAEEARRALAHHPIPARDRFRGRFRETYRALLTSLAPLLDALGRRGVESGSLGRPDDLFFLPWETAEDLDRGGRLAWTRDAVFNNRAEHESLAPAAEPLDEMSAAHEMAQLPGERPEWRWGPLLPLP